MAISDPLIGRQLGDYRIIGVIGRGGMASVYRGYDARLDRYAAVKVIGAHLMSDMDHEDYRNRFLREARAIARLSHPNIVGVYQFGDVDNLYYMAMVLIEGRNLSQIIKEYATVRQLMPRAQVARVARDIAAALDCAHANGVIHRDVKPSNIMVTSDGQAILTDFGLALSASEGTIGNTFGSAHYIAPEQAISSANAVPQSDLYGLGVVLYQLLTGRVPFDDPSPMIVALKHIKDELPPPSRFHPSISVEVERILLHALEKHPGDRYPTGDALASALTRALEGASALAPVNSSGWNGDEWDAGSWNTITPADLASGSTVAYDPSSPTISRTKRLRQRLAGIGGAVAALALAAGLISIVAVTWRDAGTPTSATALTSGVSIVEAASTSPTPPSVLTSAGDAQDFTVTPVAPRATRPRPALVLDIADAPTSSPTSTATATASVSRTPRPTRTMTDAPINTVQPTSTAPPTATATRTP
ncbi:MAG: protein kinase, partial [Chloroflexota bacterium]|nr:protein kinase [Chloroflexota bacterium]